MNDILTSGIKQHGAWPQRVKTRNQVTYEERSINFQVGSLRVIQFGAIVMMFVGVLGKIGALFVTIPDPIVGGVFMVMFGMIAAVGISNLQFADMNSSRNLFIVGFSIIFGLAMPHYMNNHPNAIQTGMIK